MRQKAIHETPDNEKNVIGSIKTGVVLDDNNEKSDPTKSPTPTVNNNKLPNGTPLKRNIKTKCFYTPQKKKTLSPGVKCFT